MGEELRPGCAGDTAFVEAQRSGGWSEFHILEKVPGYCTAPVPGVRVYSVLNCTCTVHKILLFLYFGAK